MALDFPTSPTVGQVYTVGSLTYIWNGYAWEGGGSVALPSVAVVSDTPPVSPVPGALWWESDTGLLFVNYADGSSTQWVQINSVRDEPPAGGGEYVRVNGVWRLKSQAIDLVGKTTYDMTVPAGAKMMLLRGAVYSATAAMTSVAAYVSIDGTNWLSTASSYQYGGLIHYTGSNGYTTLAMTISAFMYLAINQDTGPTAAPMIFDARCPLIRAGTTAADHWLNLITSSATSGAAATQTMHTVHRVYIIGVASGPPDIKKYRFFLTSGANFGAGSVLNAEWVY
jgi:hypothetical protein